MASSAPASRQPLHGVTEHLRAGIVDVGFDHGNRGCFHRARRLTDQDAQNVGLLREIVAAGAVTDRGDLHRRHHAEITRQSDSNRRTGGCGQFHCRPTRVNRLARHERRGGRSWNGHHAVISFHRSAAEIERRTVNSLRAEQLKAQARAHNIGDRIHRADFMKVDLLKGNLVHRGFRFAQPLKHGGSVLLYAIRHRCRLNHFQNSRKMPMLLRLIHMHVKLRGRDAAPLYLFERHRCPAVERAQAIRDGSRVRAGVGKRANQHVSADARKGVQIADPHSVRETFIILYVVAQAPIIPYLG